MLSIPSHWGEAGLQQPLLPLLQGGGSSGRFGDPVGVAEQLALMLPLLSCDAVARATPSLPFDCWLGALALGPLQLFSIWGPGMRGEVEGTERASFILPYRGSGRFRLGGRNFANNAGETLLYLPPEPWRTRNDWMGGVTIRLDPALIQEVGCAMAGPRVPAARWLTLAREPLMLRHDPAGNGRLFAALYRLMARLNTLLLAHGAVPEAVRLDDRLMRLIVALMAPALLVPAEASDLEEEGTRIESLLDWLHAHCQEPISLSDLEQRSHYSRRSLQYAFKHRFGCGPMQYLRRLRLWRARRQLQQAGAAGNLTSVALACGYLDLGSFSRDFRRLFGAAPSSLRPSRSLPARPAPPLSGRV